MRGTADLPLHGGKAPPWLFKRMVSLARGIGEVMVLEYGQLEFLRRLSDPFWFQALSCVLGFDWHSSGTTTVATGALKEALSPEGTGIAVAGGKGKASLKAPLEIAEMGEALGLGDSTIRDFQRISKLSAKVDNALVQDGFQLYHHTFFFTEQRNWTVIQQGMNNAYARRYHWFETPEFINEPHTAIMGARYSDHVLNLTDPKSDENRSLELDLVRDGPEKLERLFHELEIEMEKIKRIGNHRQTRLMEWDDPGTLSSVVPSFGGTDGRKGSPLTLRELPERKLMMPMHINWDAIRDAYEFVPSDYTELISVKGIGPSTVRSLALIGELIYGAEASWKDPIKFSFAVGGKDGVPFPVDRDAMDESIDIIRSGIRHAKAGEKDRLRAMERLRKFVPRDR